MDNKEPLIDLRDPLLACLITIAKQKSIPCSDNSLVAGLPLVEGRLNPELFVKAAGRVGLDAKIVEKPLKDIPNIVFPVTLLLRENKAVLLISHNSTLDEFTIIEPNALVDPRAFDALDNDTLNDIATEKIIKSDELAQEYSGYAIYTRVGLAIASSIKTAYSSPEGKQDWFWSIMGSSWRIYRDVLLASFLINLFVIANPLFVMNVYDRVVPNSALETLWVLAIGVLIVFVFDALLKALRGYFIEVAGKKSDILLSSFLLERVLGTKYSEKPRSVGAFTSQFREFDQLRNFYTSSTITALIDIPFAVIFLLLIFYIGGSIVVVPIIALGIIFTYSFIMRKPIRNTVEQTSTIAAHKNALLVESMVGLETIKTLGAESIIQGLWERSMTHLSLWSQKMRLLSLSVGVFSGAVTQASQVIIVMFGVYAIAGGQMTIGALIASVILSGRVLAPMAQAVTLMMSYDQAKIALTTLDTIVNKAQERDTTKAFVKRQEFKGSITFKHVSFSYPGEEQESLKDVSFTIEPGQKVGLIGRIGSGKSTINKLILNLYKPSQGSVLLDGIDVQQIDPADLRNQIAYIPQDLMLFSGSIKSNITYGSTKVDDQQIIKASSLAGLDDVVNDHPLGFERPVGERGEGLSGGEKQSVGLARALLHNVPIYLFDEPSGAMDSSTELKVTQNIAETIQNKTLLLITHKASLLQLVDRLLVIDQGKIIADGPKAQVLEALQKGELRVAL